MNIYIYKYIPNMISKSRIMESCPRKLQKSIHYHYVLYYSGKKKRYKYQREKKKENVEERQVKEGAEERAGEQAGEVLGGLPIRPKLLQQPEMFSQRSAALQGHPVRNLTRACVTVLELG